jgi:hypothetical protein
MLFAGRQIIPDAEKEGKEINPDLIFCLFSPIMIPGKKNA